jgi:hypothetical protein
MNNRINWLLIPVGIILVMLFASNLEAPQTSAGVVDPTRFFYNPYIKHYSQRLMNDPNYRRVYEQSEANWFGPYVGPHNRSIIWKTIAFSLLLIFGVLGFGISLLIRVIHIYFDWRDGNKINWPLQVFIALAVPAAYVLAMVEVMLIAPITGQ